jgi:ferredoxin
MSVELSDLESLVAALRESGFTVVGPTVQDAAIVLAELESAAQLPYGVGVDVAPGRYRLRARDDTMAFGHASGPQSLKTFLHPPRTLLVEAHRDADGGMQVTEPEPAETRYAFLGVRDCDLRAMEVQGHVLGRGGATAYANARERAFIVAVNCTEPASSCFCVSAGGGPGVSDGYDVALTELVDATGRVRYLAEAGSPAGETVLGALPSQSAPPELDEQAREEIASAARNMNRALPKGDLRDLLAASREAPRWDDVANRCLACGNCTMVCPTCFCTTVQDTTDVTGDHAQRWQLWDSCFDIDFSHLHGGPVRPTVRGRYRQWLSHKLGTWHDQFGESGCVGCGRCIVWCPVGIDITEEMNALATATQLSAAVPAAAEG